MKARKILFAASLAVCIAAVCCACGSSGSDVTNTSAVKSMISDYSQDSSALTFSKAKWKYDSSNDVYYRIGIGYCSDPATTSYETMGIYVPGKYMTGKKNSDGTYTCTVSDKGKVKGYTASTAPIVFPVNTPGYSAQAAPASYSYSNIKKYMKAGFVYVEAGMRGRANGTGSNKFAGGAPWGVTDLKAAVRYYRFNSSKLPGDTDSIFTFGHSGGGAQSSVMGASGDSSMYFDYLTSIGSAMYDKDKNYISDAICGAMCWCPITALDQADEAYEWNMGQFSSSGTRSSSKWTSLLSDDLAGEYASYINDLKLQDSSGNELTLEKSSSGIYLKGSYYDYILKVIQKSLNNFLQDTSFPYTASASQTNAGMAVSAPSGMSGSAPSGMSGTSGKSSSGSSSGSADGKTYKTAKAYIKSLNSDVTWIKYNEDKNTVTILNLRGFVKTCKTASKDVGAFDALDRSQAENDEFGTVKHDTLHFDANMSKLLTDNASKYSKKSGWKSSYVSAYKKDRAYKDSAGHKSAYRMNMYNPMYYLCSYYDGYGTSDVAKYWRINTGIEQGDTALTTETNLALALKQNDSVKSAALTTVWAQGHTQAERTGNADSNFIKWVNKSLSSND